jgi:hypothetical protein
MNGFTWLHWGVLGIIGFLFLIALFFILRLRGQTQLVAFIVLILFGGLTVFMSVISLDKATKKSTLTRVTNKRVLRTEEIIFKGYVVNTGKYPIAESKLEVKLINHGKSTGKVKGTDFYRTNSIFGSLFSSSGEKKKSRPSSLSYSFNIAKELKVGQRKRFSVRFKFPTYFKDVDFRFILHSDFASHTVKLKDKKTSKSTKSKTKMLRNSLK